MYFWIVVSILIGLNEAGNLSKCALPKGCRIQKVNDLINPLGNDKVAGQTKKGFRCDIFEGFHLEFNLSLVEDSNQKCELDIEKYETILEMRWLNRDEEKSILDKNFNLSNIFKLTDTFLFKSASLNLINVKGFEIFNSYDNFKNYLGTIGIERIICLSCKIKFYIEKSLVKSCEDIFKANMTDFQSIFQIFPVNIDIFGFNFSPGYMKINLIDSDFGKYPWCPLVFYRSRISMLSLKGLVNSFYKINVLSFSDYNESVYSEIQALELNNVQNIDLDSNLLHQFVFQKLQSLYVRGSVRTINGTIFKTLGNLWFISFQTVYFRSIMHRKGINWIRSINDDLHVNISNKDDVNKKFGQIKNINFECFNYAQDENMAMVFPDEDFCLYIDYPFDQLVIMIQYCLGQSYVSLINQTDTIFSCTYLWLIKYYEIYYYVYDSKMFENYIWGVEDQATIRIYINIKRILSDRKYNASLKKCNFDKMIQNCNKSHYKVKDIWGRFDYMILNTKLEIIIRIASYVVSLLGMVTNLIVIITILAKKNAESFKDIKHYRYLWINSLFSVLMLFIQVVSWMSECFYPYEVFCPEIRKLVVIQVFKMVFKECFVVAFRFMCNFTYIAFAFNRISLLDNNSSKLVKFMSDVGLKKYLAVTLFISCGLSSVKFFKYDINHDHPESNYPISNELDLTAISWTKISNDAFIIINSIVDLLNYVVFEIVNIIVDIYLVLTLRRTLNEKANKLKALYGKDSKKLEDKENEFKDIVDKAIKMVVLNTVISILFKLPISFIPVVNVYAEFYYKNFVNLVFHPHFGYFYSFLLDSGFYKMIIHLSDFFFTFSLFIQLFIYIRFDKKFKAGFKNLFSSLKNNSA